MLEAYVHDLNLQNATGEDAAATRARVKDRFARGATRRMTQLGLLVSTALADLDPDPTATVIYLSAYGESRALEGYLDSFPAASPTQFQTSIHPSAVQQAFIGRQQPVGEFLPMTGRLHLVAQGLQTALLCPSRPVIVCGGEERGGWLLENGVASARSFAFAFSLQSAAVGAVARISLTPSDEPPRALLLADFFDALAARRPLDPIDGPGARLALEWI
ncbi:hypothetical protein [Synoicihabitans lomoniglobus]|uniref:Uncharacterized protein n=1 Tax=Synoicihabitans lomoniglobus TaxID=2909285 RepID=A0AAE9ZUC1_9BACT|nr:hypothetical protein [Opitutaceae bacterium LMO-M01]WED64456.1 hypothetical protein PXH66_19120 [Opitutaceae bacterium LMO-M01]